MGDRRWAASVSVFPDLRSPIFDLRSPIFHASWELGGSRFSSVWFVYFVVSPYLGPVEGTTKFTKHTETHGQPEREGDFV